jgi:hypothetical protein
MTMTMSMYANRDAEGKKYLRCMLAAYWAEWDGDEGDESLDVASTYVTTLCTDGKKAQHHNTTYFT